MNDEEQRLLTFTSWPTDSPIAPAVLAKAGFYYTGKNYDVKCFSCNVIIHSLHPDEDIHQKHKLVSPDCPFLLNPFISENIPLFRTERIYAEDTSKGLQNYKARLDTFRNWPYGRIVSGEELAAAGFYALGHGDKVKCAFCYGIAAYWEPGDDPKFEHKRHFPKCKFVLADFNITDVNKRPKSLATAAESPYTSYTFSKHNISTPVSPKYDTKENRLATFTKWPFEKRQRPPALADAGFFYLGIGDKVQCFYCGGTLKNWQPDDDVWVEHARWFPSCNFVKFVKGAEFIEHCTDNSDSDSESTFRSPFPSVTSMPRSMSTVNVIRSEEVANVTLNEPPSKSEVPIKSPMERRGHIFKKRQPSSSVKKEKEKAKTKTKPNKKK